MIPWNIVMLSISIIVTMLPLFFVLNKIQVIHKKKWRK